MIGVLGSLAEYERELIKERTALKRAASRVNGTRFGRPRKVDDAEHITTAKRMKADGHTGRDIAKYLGVEQSDVVPVPGQRRCHMKHAGRNGIRTTTTRLSRAPLLPAGMQQARFAATQK